MISTRSKGRRAALTYARSADDTAIVQSGNQRAEAMA